MMWNGGYGMMGWGGFGWHLAASFRDTAVHCRIDHCSRGSGRSVQWRLGGSSVRAGRGPSGAGILDERYARSEINREEYLQKRRDILG